MVVLRVTYSNLLRNSIFNRFSSILDECLVCFFPFSLSVRLEFAILLVTPAHAEL